jgi:hypothetical protein
MLSHGFLEIARKLGLESAHAHVLPGTQDTAVQAPNYALPVGQKRLNDNFNDNG